jgi:hypothetical protein
MMRKLNEPNLITVSHPFEARTSNGALIRVYQFEVVEGTFTFSPGVGHRERVKLPASNPIGIHGWDDFLRLCTKGVLHSDDGREVEVYKEDDVEKVRLVAKGGTFVNKKKFIKLAKRGTIRKMIAASATAPSNLKGVELLTDRRARRSRLDSLADKLGVGIEPGEDNSTTALLRMLKKDKSVSSTDVSNLAEVCSNATLTLPSIELPAGNVENPGVKLMETDNVEGVVKVGKYYLSGDPENPRWSERPEDAGQPVDYFGKYLTVDYRVADVFPT